MGVPTPDLSAEAKVCFNPAKLYQLGWHQNEFLKIIRTSAPTKITVEGFTKPEDGTIRIVKFDRRSPYDFYLGFNVSLRMTTLLRACAQLEILTQSLQ